MKKWFKAIGFGMLISLAALMIEGIVSGIISAIYVFVSLFKKGLENSSSLSNPTEMTDKLKSLMSQNNLYLISAIGIFACGIAFFFWYRWEQKKGERVSVKKVFTYKNIVLLISLGIGMQFFNCGIMNIAQHFFTKQFEDYAKNMSYITDCNIFLVLTLVVFVAPFTEELIFRGVLLHRANRYVAFIGANILQATLFGIYHFNVIQGIYAAFIGLILGAVYYKFRSIYACMFLHMTFNASSFLIQALPDKEWLIYILSVVGGVILCVALYKLKKQEMLVPDSVNVEPQDQEPLISFDKTGTEDVQ